MYIYIYTYVDRAEIRRSSRGFSYNFYYFLLFFFFSSFLLSILSSNFVTWRERLGWGEIGNV